MIGQELRLLYILIKELFSTCANVLAFKKQAQTKRLCRKQTFYGAAIVISTTIARIFMQKFYRPKAIFATTFYLQKSRLHLRRLYRKCSLQHENEIQKMVAKQKQEVAWV